MKMMRATSLRIVLGMKDSSRIVSFPRQSIHLLGLRNTFSTVSEVSSSSPTSFPSSSSSSSPITNPLSTNSISANPVPNQVAEPKGNPITSPPEPSKGYPVTVKAYFAARVIDITKIPQGRKIFGAARRQYDQRSVIIPIEESKMQHIALFKYGSVVFFNIPEEEHDKYLKDFKDARPQFSDGIQHTDNYRVLVHQQLGQPSVIKAEHLNVRSLNSNNITIIATVMAQSVALDYYTQKVDQLVDRFSNINEIIIDRGKMSSLNAKELYQLVATNNMILTALLSKMGILEVTDAAWESSDYTYTWEELRKDFEIEYRFKDLKLKLELIKDDSRFYLEGLQHRKTTVLEWLIISLIAVEVVQNSGLAIEYFFK